MPFNFEHPEFNMCRQIVAIYLRKNEKDEVPWNTLKYLIGEIVYGGKVMDNYDRKILLTYVEEYFGDFIHSSYQPFSFFNSKDGSIPLNYIKMEQKLLRDDWNINSLKGEFIFIVTNGTVKYTIFTKLNHTILNY